MACLMSTSLRGLDLKGQYIKFSCSNNDNTNNVELFYVNLGYSVQKQWIRHSYYSE